MYRRGYGVEQNYNEAIQWCSRSANQGDSWAQNNLGVMFRFGNGVRVDPKEALMWITKSANRGNVEGQYNLGEIYQEGAGVKRNAVEATKWFVKSTSSSDGLAHLRLDSMFEANKNLVFVAASLGYIPAHYKIGWSEMRTPNSGSHSHNPDRHGLMSQFSIHHAAGNGRARKRVQPLPIKPVDVCLDWFYAIILTSSTTKFVPPTKKSRFLFCS
jgi:hypothetical protein